jgi:hypothetical protein
MYDEPCCSQVDAADSTDSILLLSILYCDISVMRKPHYAC